MEIWYTSYFRRGDRATGNETLLALEDGTPPQAVLYEGAVYELDTFSQTALEAEYEYFGQPTQDLDG